MESASLAGLREVTLDVDVHLVETTKANAFYCYGGRKALQPIEEVEWAETGLVLAEEFRHGNVQAGMDIQENNALFFPFHQRKTIFTIRSRDNLVTAGGESTCRIFLRFSSLSMTRNLRHPLLFF